VPDERYRLKAGAAVGRAIQLYGQMSAIPIIGGMHHPYDQIWYSTGTTIALSVLNASHRA
jgi:hypothetical protein